MRPNRNWKDKNPIGLAIRDEVEGKPTPPSCPACFSRDCDVCHHRGDFRLPETTFKVCNACGYQWDHQ